MEASVHDKLHPSMTLADQDTSGVSRTIVPPGAFADPHNAASASSSVNLALDENPFQVSDDYAKAYREDDMAQTDGPLSPHDESMAEVDPSKHVNETNPDVAAGLAASARNEQTYEEMTVKQLKDEASSRDLSGYSSLNHAELVELLIADDQQ